MTHMLCSKSSEAIPALSENQTEKKKKILFEKQFWFNSPKNENSIIIN